MIGSTIFETDGQIVAAKHVVAIAVGEMPWVALSDRHVAKRLCREVLEACGGANELTGLLVGLDLGQIDGIEAVAVHGRLSVPCHHGSLRGESHTLDILFGKRQHADISRLRVETIEAHRVAILASEVDLAIVEAPLHA